MGFFEESAWDAKEPVTDVPLCGACGLYKTCTSPKLPVQGNGGAGILVVGSNPTKAADDHGRQWAGDMFAYVKKQLRAAGLDPVQDVWWYNALICHGKPESDRVRHCRPNMIKTIETLDPVHIVCMGYPALLSVVGHFYGSEDLGLPQRWDGLSIPNQRPNCWVTCLDNPARLDSKDGMREAFWKHYLATALQQCTDRPWPDGPPDYRQQVRIETDANKAAKLIDAITAKGGLCSFDYEATMLAPNTQQSQVVSMAICQQGKRTLSYPWHGAAIQASQRFLHSPVPKVAANMKFEDRWTMQMFGKPVRNVVYDTNLGAHVIDNRPHVTSVKFQAYTLLGEPAYNTHIEPYFHSEAPNKPNNIREIRLRDLLMYNGLDAVLEYFIAQKQMTHLGYDWRTA